MIALARACALILAATVTVTAAPHGETPAEQPENVWKPILGTAVVAEIVVVGFELFAHDQLTNQVDQIATHRTDQTRLTSDDCGRGTVSVDPGNHFASACTWHDRQVAGLYVGLGVGAFIAVSAYMAFGRHPAKHKDIAMTPTLTHDTAGASLSLEF